MKLTFDELLMLADMVRRDPDFVADLANAGIAARHNAKRAERDEVPTIHHVGPMLTTGGARKTTAPRDAVWAQGMLATGYTPTEVEREGVLRRERRYLRAERELKGKNVRKDPMPR